MKKLSSIILLILISTSLNSQIKIQSISLGINMDIAHYKLIQLNGPGGLEFSRVNSGGFFLNTSIITNNKKSITLLAHYENMDALFSEPRRFLTGVMVAGGGIAAGRTIGIGFQKEVKLLQKKIIRINMLGGFKINYMFQNKFDTANFNTYYRQSTLEHKRPYLIITYPYDKKPPIFPTVFLGISAHIKLNSKTELFVSPQFQQGFYQFTSKKSQVIFLNQNKNYVDITSFNGSAWKVQLGITKYLKKQ